MDRQPRAASRWPLAALIAAGVAALLATALVAAQDINLDDSTPRETGEHPPKAAGCPKLADALWRVTQSEDWVATATGLGVPVVKDRVRVIVELAAEQEPPADMPGLVEGRYLQFVQVLVEPALLCTLASTHGVVAVNPPFPSAPAEPVRP
ncbi:MAG TPA: hypothetical protein VFH48_13280 [Chloroflexota bacterium]|nr:hypothetical protein [Chloroflexota bacterium]